MDILRDTIADGLASLSRVTAAPTGALGFGVDLSCELDLDPTMATVDPFSVDAVAQAIVRRWDTPRGSLPVDGRDAGDYGLSLREHLNRGTTDRDLRAMETRLATEAAKDDRIAAIKVGVVATYSGSIVSLRVTATVRPVDPRVGGFRLVLSVTSSAVVITAIEGATA